MNICSVRKTPKIDGSGEIKNGEGEEEGKDAPADPTRNKQGQSEPLPAVTAIGTTIPLGLGLGPSERREETEPSRIVLQLSPPALLNLEGFDDRLTSPTGQERQQVPSVSQSKMPLWSFGSGSSKVQAQVESQVQGGQRKNSTLKTTTKPTRAGTIRRVKQRLLNGSANDIDSGSSNSKSREEESKRTFTSTSSKYTTTTTTTTTTPNPNSFVASAESSTLLPLTLTLPTLSPEDDFQHDMLHLIPFFSSDLAGSGPNNTTTNAATTTATTLTPTKKTDSTSNPIFSKTVPTSSVGPSMSKTIIHPSSGSGPGSGSSSSSGSNTPSPALTPTPAAAAATITTTNTNTTTTALARAMNHTRPRSSDLSNLATNDAWAVTDTDDDSGSSESDSSSSPNSSSSSSSSALPIRSPSRTTPSTSISTSPIVKKTSTRTSRTNTPRSTSSMSIAPTRSTPSPSVVATTGATGGAAHGVSSSSNSRKAVNNHQRPRPRTKSRSGSRQGSRLQEAAMSSVVDSSSSSPQVSDSNTKSHRNHLGPSHPNQRSNKAKAKEDKSTDNGGFIKPSSRPSSLSSSMYPFASTSTMPQAGRDITAVNAPSQSQTRAGARSPQTQSKPSTSNPSHSSPRSQSTTTTTNPPMAPQFRDTYLTQLPPQTPPINPSPGSPVNAPLFAATATVDSLGRPMSVNLVDLNVMHQMQQHMLNPYPATTTLTTPPLPHPYPHHPHPRPYVHTFNSYPHPHSRPHPTHAHSHSHLYHYRKQDQDQDHGSGKPLMTSNNTLPPLRSRSSMNGMWTKTGSLGRRVEREGGNVQSRSVVDSKKKGMMMSGDLEEVREEEAESSPGQGHNRRKKDNHTHVSSNNNAIVASSLKKTAGKPPPSLPPPPHNQRFHKDKDKDKDVLEGVYDDDDVNVLVQESSTPPSAFYLQRQYSSGNGNSGDMGRRRMSSTSFSSTTSGKWDHRRSSSGGGAQYVPGSFGKSSVTAAGAGAASSSLSAKVPTEPDKIGQALRLDDSMEDPGTKIGLDVEKEDDDSESGETLSSSCSSESEEGIRGEKDVSVKARVDSMTAPIQGTTSLLPPLAISIPHKESQDATSSPSSLSPGHSKDRPQLISPVSVERKRVNSVSLSFSESMGHRQQQQQRPTRYFPLALFLSQPELLALLLKHLTFRDWCTITSISKTVRMMVTENELLKEEVLERFLRPVGYIRWGWRDSEPISLTLQDLHDYMRGISIPLTAYTRVAELYLKQLKVKHSRRDPNVIENAILLRDATRAYNRILLRLRAQAEMDPDQFTPTANTPTDHSQPQVPTTIMEEGNNKASPSLLTGNNGQSSSEPHLPSMFRLRRAPLLRVFIPSPEGDWLSDTSVSQCEAEIKYAGLSHLVRMGDVVWDIAVGDNGNFGRMIWDGKYLIDLDYTYSEVGDVPKYIPILVFPPSYFYRVLRTSPSSSSDPLVRIDISHWGEEIATNLQLLQNRGRMERLGRATTVYHNTNWVHQSWFRIKPPQSQQLSLLTSPSLSLSLRSKTSIRPSVLFSSSLKSGNNNNDASTSDSNNNNDNKGVPVPGFAGHFIHPTWYGKIVIETEGTADSLTDLQDRCGPKAFPNRVKPVTKTVVGSSQRSAERDKDARTAFRIVRERSQPGEIWLRTVSAKERRRV